MQRLAHCLRHKSHRPFAVHPHTQHDLGQVRNKTASAVHSAAVHKITLELVGEIDLVWSRPPIDMHEDHHAADQRGELPTILTRDSD